MGVQMNLIQFLKKTDECMDKMTKEQLAYFIHEEARNLNEEKREIFLGNLIKSLNREESAKEADGNEENRALKKEIREKTADVRKKIREINAGKVSLTSVINEEYDDWYNSSAPEFLFEDPEHIFKTIEEACKLVHLCIDAELYSDSYKLADDLIATEINTLGDYAEYCDEWVSVYELVTEQFLEINYKQLILDALYAAYQGNMLEDRPQALYDIICNSQYSAITIEEMLQQGAREPEQCAEFLRLWIEFLKKQNTRISTKLLEEAVDLAGDASYLLEEARESAKLHPELYLHLLEKCKQKKEWKKGIEIGQEAVEKIPSIYKTRGKCAVMTSVFAQQLKMTELAEECWKKAFESDTTVVNYLRLITESKDSSEYTETVKRICRDVYSRNGTSSDIYGRYSGPELNVLSKTMYFSLAFLSKEWDTVLQKGMQVREGVGWTGTFMKQGIALFCLALYSKDELQSGCREMLRQLTWYMNFNSDEYASGLIQNMKIKDSELLWKCLLKWKENLSISETEQKQIIMKLEKWVELRVQGIMDGNHRKYYNECAAFIAALGEVKEICGEKNAKADLMEEYRILYPRRRAFHEELRGYGMKDTRKHR